MSAYDELTPFEKTVLDVLQLYITRTLVDKGQSSLAPVGYRESVYELFTQHAEAAKEQPPC